MKAAYVDTSCLLAVAFEEPGWEKVRLALGRIDLWLSSTFTEAEFRAALRREEIADDEIALLRGVTYVIPNRPLTEEIREVLSAGYVRGADLWHLSCAIFVSPEPKELAFATLDRSQALVATSLGFPPVRGINERAR